MQPPPGWLVKGSAARNYEMTIDESEHHSGTRCAVIRSIKDPTSGFGTLMQEILPNEHLDKRLRLSAWIKTRDVAKGCGIWMRIDGSNGAMLGFDNMYERSIQGTNDWRRCEIVLDVPKSTELIAFGGILDGVGTMWLDDVRFETVGPEVPVTGRPPLSTQPRNLDFEES